VAQRFQGNIFSVSASELICGQKPHRRLAWAKNQVFKLNEVTIMAKVCQVTGKRPMSGNNVSHANNRTKRRFLPNLQSRRFWVESENRWVRLRVSTNALRTIDKKGIDVILAEMRANGQSV